MAYTNKTLIRTFLEGEVQDQDASRVRALFQVADPRLLHLLVVSSQGEKGEEKPLWGLFHKGTNPIKWGSILMT